MRVRVDERTCALEEPDDLRRLSAVTALSGPALREAMREQSLGEPDTDGEHVWIEPEALRSRGIAEPDWLERFEAMRTFAAAHGWTDGAGRIRVHLESAGESQ